MNRTHRNSLGLWLPLTLLTLAGCASTPRGASTTASEVPKGRPASSATAGTAVEQRAEQRWTYLINGQPDLAYAYLTPGYRQTRSRDEYSEIMRDRPVKWVGVNFQDKDCEGQSCKVRLMITYTLDMPVQMVGKVESVDFVTETWLWIEGDWYFLPTADPKRGLR